MRNIIFNSDSVQMKSYLEKRLEIGEQPIAYIAGNTIKMQVNMSHLLNEENEMNYTLAIEDGCTVEIIEYDGLVFELYTKVSPIKLIGNNDLKHLLKVGLFEEVSKSDWVQIENSFKESGFIINKNCIYTKSYNFKISKRNNFFAIKYPLIGINKQVSKEFEKLHSIVQSIVRNKETKNKSFV